MNVLSVLVIMVLSFSTSAKILSPGQVIGFSDSSFNYSSDQEAQSATFCYWGDFDQTCNEIASSAQSMNAGYSQGNHDRIEVRSCELVYAEDEYGQDKVVTTYTLSDDYGYEFKVTREIKSCIRSSNL